MDPHPNDTSTSVGTGQVGGSELEFVRSEERIGIQLDRTAVETVRVSRRIVTETVQVPVTVRREELTVTRTPVGGSQQSHGVPGPVEDLVLVLHEEQPVVTLRVRPIERVTIGVDTVATERVVTADLRSEQVEVEAPGSKPDRARPDRS